MNVWLELLLRVIIGFSIPAIFIGIVVLCIIYILKLRKIVHKYVSKGINKLIGRNK
jgi:hypothetical protein